MSHTVRLTSAAWRDLEDLCVWISEHDSPAKAGHVLDRIVETAESLAGLPHRGSRPDELPPGLDIEYRQVFFKPYRIIYEVTRSEVVIHLIADGRRNLQSLLMRRLRIG
jgi:toxin ParE1/3/4